MEKEIETLRKFSNFPIKTFIRKRIRVTKIKIFNKFAKDRQMNILKNIKECYQHIHYTFKHYLAFRKVEKKVLGYHKYWHHDWDKLILYTFCPWLGVKKIHRIHQRRNSHHPSWYDKYGIEHLKKAYDIDFVEAIIDWECARYTKKDKPLNAYETMFTYYPEYQHFVLPMLEELKLIERKQMAVSVEYLRGMVEDCINEIPSEIERIKKSDFKENIKEEQIAWKEGMKCAYQIVQKCL